MRSRALTACALVLSGCSLSLEGFSGGPSNAADGGATADAGSDDASEGGARDAASMPGTVISTNGDFADGCNGFVTFQATITPTSDGRSGGGCKVCPTSPSASFSLNQQFAGPKVGEVYHGELWVKLADASRPSTVEPTFRTFDASGKASDIDGTSVTALTSTWKHVALTHPSTKAGATIEFYAYGHAGDDCFVVDDYLVTRESP